jgi:antibiotic biosynthesis monooxygenase (ABM) superfamily enzyme
MQSVSHAGTVRPSAENEPLLDDGSASAASVSAITTRFTLAEASLKSFAAWQAELSRTASAASGFVSIELIPTYAGSPEWQVVQRFRSGDALQAWRTGGARAAIFAKLRSLLSPDHPDILEEAAPDFHATSFVTEVITTSVHPGGEGEFQAFAQGVQSAQASFPGYMGTLIQAPVSQDLPYWTTLVRFATPSQLDAWIASDERRALLARADPKTSTWTSRRMQSGFAAWFPGAASDAPPAWKQTMLVLLVLFPVVMLEIRFLSPYLASFPLAIATFIGNALSVALVSWPLMSFAVAGLGWWLKPAPERHMQVEVLGLATVLGLYAIEIVLFMFLFTS